MLKAPDAYVGLMIDAVIDDAALTELAQRLRCDADAVSIYVFALIEGQASSILGSGFNPELVAPYEEHYWRLDPWASIRSETTVPLNSFVSDDEFRASEIYNDLLKVRCDIFRCMGATARTMNGELRLAFHRSEHQPVFEPEFLRSADTLNPGFVRLLEARRRLASGAAMIAARTLETEPDPVWVFDAAGRLLHLNAAARWFVGVAPLDLAGGRLVGPAVLVRAVRAACAGPAGRTLGSEAEGWLMEIDRLPGAPPAACVRAIDLRARLERRLGRLAALYSLSVAELEAARALAEGVGPVEHASRRSVRIATVRSQMQSLFAKTGVGGQIAFLALLNAQGS